MRKLLNINEGQDKDVLELIKYIPIFSATDVFLHSELSNKWMLITSVRRSINTLMKAGYIEPTGERVMGLYGRKELQYRLV